MKSSSKKRRCTWYIEPLTELANENIAKHLGSDVSMLEHFGIACKDGKRHNLWEVEFRVISSLVKSQKLHTVHVWRSYGKNEPQKVTTTVKKFYQPKISKKGALKKASEIKTKKGVK